MRRALGAGGRARTSAGRLCHGRWICLARIFAAVRERAGNGQWNLGRYLIARGSDLPLRDLEIEMLPPLANEAPKGMAEVVMIPVVPALLNAIFDATGRRFRALPVTQRMLKGAIS